MYRDRFLRTRVVFKIVSKYSILRLLQIYKWNLQSVRRLVLKCIGRIIYKRSFFIYWFYCGPNSQEHLNLQCANNGRYSLFLRENIFTLTETFMCVIMLTHFQIVKFMNRKLIWISYKACNNPIIQCNLHTHFTFCTILINCSIFLKLGKKSMIF